MSTLGSIINMTDYSETAGLAAASLPGGALPGASSLEGGSAALSGAPDPAWIGQLANSIFNVWPGSPVPAAGASQPSVSAFALEPSASLPAGGPPFEPPVSETVAQSAPFVVPSLPGGASQPSVPVYAYEALRPTAYAPPSSPAGASGPSAPILAYDAARPGAWAPPSSPAGASGPSAPLFGPEVLEPAAFPPPSSPSGAGGPSGPLHAFEPLRPAGYVPPEAPFGAGQQSAPTEPRLTVPAQAGASQPSAQIFAYEKLPNGAPIPNPPTAQATQHPFGQAPGPNTEAPSPNSVGLGALDHPATGASILPTSPASASAPSAPVYTYEAWQPAAWTPPSSPSGASAPAAPIFAPEALAPLATLPSAPSGAVGTSVPLHGFEPVRPAGYELPEAPFGAGQPVFATEPRFSAPAASGAQTGASQPSAPIFATGPRLTVPAAPGAQAGASQPSAPIFAYEKSPQDGAPLLMPPNSEHPFGQSPGPNTVAPSPTSVGSGALDHPGTAAFGAGSPPSQADLGGSPSSLGVLLSLVPLIDPSLAPYGREPTAPYGREPTPQAGPHGGAPASETYSFLDEVHNGGTITTTSSYARQTRLFDSGAPLQPWQGVRPHEVSGNRAFIPHTFRDEFPILHQEVNGRKLIWLDNAATTQKPQAVIDRIAYFYAHENSNVHRAAHTLAARSTDAFELAREKVRRFLNAPSVKDIIFVRGTTEGINLVSQSWGRRNVGEGDEILITHLEHHSNIVPWQMLAAEKGAKLRVAPVDDSGQVILDEYEKLLNPRTRIVAFTHVSNALGTITPVREMVAMAHRHGARVLVDGAQAVSHMPVDVQALDADFYVFSGHKVFGPTGIGIVYGRSEELAAMPPWQGGGSMISDVTFERTVYMPPPERFEAGTSNIADAVGLGAAIDYVERIGRGNIAAYEHELLTYMTQHLLTVPGLRIIGTANEKAGAVSFVLNECRTEDVGKALDLEGIAVRAGHHCAQPILRRFGLEATVRPSLALYNTPEDVDALVAAVLRIATRRTQRS
jgi:cysteine desulfurase/selenocysteine lyase